MKRQLPDNVTKPGISFLGMPFRSRFRRNRVEAANAGLLGAQRSATVFVAVLACLVIATALVTSTVRTALQARRAVRNQCYLQQTQLLLAAGVQRAALQVATTAEYQGETWKLPPEVLPGNHPAEIEITLSPDSQGLSRKVSVTARLLVSAHSRFQRSYAFSLEPSPPPGKE